MEKTDESTSVAVESNSEDDVSTIPLTPVHVPVAEDASKEVVPEISKPVTAPSAASASTTHPTPAPAETPKHNHTDRPVPPTPVHHTTSPVALTPKSGAVAISVDRARSEVNRWLKAGNKLSQVDMETLQVLMKDHDGIKEKIGKLKSLLGRSAKAQREAKVDLDGTQKRLDHALREIDRLNKKIDKLANRPTHMELLADFETNFDRALLSVGQSGGQDTASPMEPVHVETDAPVVDALLMQELQEAKQRIATLEGLNGTLGQRSSQLENETKDHKRERDELKTKVTHLELEKRMAVMEAEHAMKAMQEKAASLAEMQMEIDMVTKASVNANARAAHGEEMIKTVKTDREHVHQLESQVQALQEWALASAEAKTLAQERVRLLETQLAYLKHETVAASTAGDSSERTLFVKTGSIVVGAGDVGFRVVSLEDEHLQTLKRSQRVVLRWQFDLKSDDYDIDFSVLKGACETAAKRKKADYLIKNRKVMGGAAGDLENAFAIQNASTVLWSNTKAWIRPKTAQFRLEAVVMND